MLDRYESKEEVNYPPWVTEARTGEVLDWDNTLSGSFFGERFLSFAEMCEFCNDVSNHLSARQLLSDILCKCLLLKDGFFLSKCMQTGGDKEKLRTAMDFLIIEPGLSVDEYEERVESVCLEHIIKFLKSIKTDDGILSMFSAYVQ